MIMSRQVYFAHSERKGISEKLCVDNCNKILILNIFFIAVVVVFFNANSLWVAKHPVRDGENTTFNLSKIRRDKKDGNLYWM